MNSVDVYLGIGSNIEDRIEHIKSAFRDLKALFSHLKTASLYETKPMYVLDQSKFINTVFFGQTRLPAFELLQEVQNLEAHLGRNRSESMEKGPRPIDIDILLYGNKVIDLPDLMIPHPLMKERPFVLVPLVEMAPGLIDPVTQIPYKEYLKSLDARDAVLYSKKLG